MAFAANQMPIMTAARRTGATWLTRERPPDPTGSRCVPRNRAVSSLFRPCGPPSPALSLIPSPAKGRERPLPDPSPPSGRGEFCMIGAVARSRAVFHSGRREVGTAFGRFLGRPSATGTVRPFRAVSGGQPHNPKRDGDRGNYFIFANAAARA